MRSAARRRRSAAPRASPERTYACSSSWLGELLRAFGSYHGQLGHGKLTASRDALWIRHASHPKDGRIGKMMQPLTGAAEIALAQQREYRERGFLRESFALSDPAPLPQLCRDVALFDAKLAEWHARGHARVPYLFTEAIERVARDAAIRVVIEALLGTDAWVVWGHNILRESPNAASRWHVDLESRYWPSVTVAVGLSGCSAEGAVWCLPGTHLLARRPSSCGDDGDTDLVLQSARRAKPDCGPP